MCGNVKYFLLSVHQIIDIEAMGVTWQYDHSEGNISNNICVLNYTTM